MSTMPESGPAISTHFQTREPSAIRLAQIEFMKRSDGVDAVNVAIGNVSLPMHPAMQERLRSLGETPSPFSEGVVKYSATVGLNECRAAFLNIIASSGFPTSGLQVQITDGGSAAMELLIVGLCGEPGSGDRPLLLIDAAYTNYMSLAARTGRSTISVRRTLGRDGRFSLPDLENIEKVIRIHRPGALVVIPYDNPTGHFYDDESMAMLARLCVKYNTWLVSDEAYRELYYLDAPASSIWGISESRVPGITGRRVSIETASKVWNACGLRIGALVTDNRTLHARAVAEATANLCPNVIGQHIFGVLAHQSHGALGRWYAQQRAYYSEMLHAVSSELRERIPGLIVSSPDAAIYSVIDVRELVPSDFDSSDFVMYCAREGSVTIQGKAYTLLVSPMAGFYRGLPGQPNPGGSQMRIAYVEPPQRMRLVPLLLDRLLASYLDARQRRHVRQGRVNTNTTITS